ncbi:hypothetical protein B0H14DRAFT_2572826 [Mycena olivaceomarginata]|nr:hypothetical protein B0H14DRAFT_2572826 [Mycena olivaceomarginata]
MLAGCADRQTLTAVATLTAISRLQAIQSPASATVGRVDTSEGLGVRCVEESQRIWREVARGGARQPRTKLAVAGHSFAGKTLPRRLDQPRQSLAKRGRTAPVTQQMAFEDCSGEFRVVGQYGPSCGDAALTEIAVELGAKCQSNDPTVTAAPRTPNAGRTQMMLSCLHATDTQEICRRIFISEDEFELVMGLFETLTGPQPHQELPDFSIFKPFFLAPLHPDTFASHIVPSWIRPPSVLSSIALTIYPYWHQRRSLRGGRKICPLLNTEENDHINAAYAGAKVESQRRYSWAAEGGVFRSAPSYRMGEVRKCFFSEITEAQTYVDDHRPHTSYFNGLKDVGMSENRPFPKQETVTDT